MRVKPVIMAGGTGKRLWPLSSEDKPKQFKKLSGELTLLQQTLTRNRFLGKPTIITPSKYAPITKKQTDEIGIEIELITEPAQKNTAICAIITALAAEAQGFDLLVLLPSDHYIENEQNYYDTINKTLDYVKNYGICTIGIPINVINTEYGYIKSELSIAENVYQVDCFIEKPTFEEAKKYFESNEYFWNSGIFIYDVSFFLSLAMSLQPELFEIAVDAYNNAIKTENNIVLDCKKYNEAESISIDHAIMEYICGMVMVKADFSWNDLGTWHSLLQVKQQDMRDRLPAKFTYREEFVGNTSPRTAAYIDICEDASTGLTQKLPLEVEFCRRSNNYCEGQVVTSNTTNSFISSNDKLTTVIGLDNVIVIDTVNGLLVADKSKTTEIQELILKVGKS